jgi:uncharacterized protein YndB with AHSA1/START domain
MKPLNLLPDTDLDLVLERIVPLTLHECWDAWTMPEHLVHWFCPKPWQTIACEIDLRPGGVFQTVMRGPEGQEHGSLGCFLEVVHLHRLVWTDALGPDFRPNEKPFMTGTLTFDTAEGGVRYRAVAQHATPQIRAQHEEMGFQQGWGIALDQLVAYMQSLR